jgi:hypothetical protein
MADWFSSIDDERKKFIEKQHIFFVGTAPSDAEGEVNVSPKGRTLLKVLGPNLVGWLDYPGSGNETSKHTAQNGRITLMFCSFDSTACILRLYGHGRAVSLDDPKLVQYRHAFKSDAHPFVRQAFFVDIEKVQTSCGYAVPRMQFLAERDTLDRWCDNRLEPRDMSDGFPVAGPLRRKDGSIVAV